MKAPDEETLMAMFGFKAEKPEEYGRIIAWLKSAYQAQLEENTDIAPDVSMRQGQGKAKGYRDVLTIMSDPRREIEVQRKLKATPEFDHAKT